MPARVAVVADDLTGTLDTAGPFAARGCATWAVVSARDCTRDQLAAAQVVSINCASRHLAAGDAAAAVRDAVARLCPPQAEILIKKIDSTLRGNVAVETLAALSASGRPNAIVLPAFPAQGRTVRAGVVHVMGVPLAQTGFARDALSPPPLEPLERVFASAAPQARVASVPPDGPFALAARGEAPKIFVVDSETDADLQRSVHTLGARLSDCVLVGSAGVAAAVAQVCMPAGPVPVRPRVSGQVLFVVGSRAEQSAAQVGALRERAGVAVSNAHAGVAGSNAHAGVAVSNSHAGVAVSNSHTGVAVFDAPDGVSPDAAMRCSEAAVLVLRATPGAGAGHCDAETVAARLAQAVVGVLRSRPAIGALLATGGDTAVAILQALAQPALQVMGDVLPGIPYCRIELDGRTLWLLTKAGGFGTRGTLVEVLELLHA